MNYEDRIVCFLDILGFKGYVEASQIEGRDNEEKIEEIASMLSSIRESLAPLKRQHEVTQFSDSVVISFLVETDSGVFDVLHELLLLQITLAQQGYLCRGGVARGKLIHTSQMLFGPAIIEAYALESEVAVYPRVILSLDIVNAGVAAHEIRHAPAHEQERILSLLKKDVDGMYYIDYIEHPGLGNPELGCPYYLSCLRCILAKGLNASRIQTKIKYKWLREKLFPYLHAQKSWASKLPTGHDLRDVYEKISCL